MAERFFFKHLCPANLWTATSNPDAQAATGQPYTEPTTTPGADLRVYGIGHSVLLNFYQKRCLVNSHPDCVSRIWDAMFAGRVFSLYAGPTGVFASVLCSAYVRLTPPGGLISCEQKGITSEKGVGHDLPEVVLVDGANSPHLGHFSPNTDELETNVGTGFDGQALVVGELRWCGVCVVDTVLGDGLDGYC